MDKTQSSMPKHIAFIMDGNGRWAKLRGLPRTKGHQQGLNVVDGVVEWCISKQIEVVSLYVFSTENWSRSSQEINGLFDLARSYLKNVSKFKKKNVKVLVSGSNDKLPNDLVEQISKAMFDTKDCSGVTLNLCINYGGRQEIVSAVNKCIDLNKPVTVGDFAKCLYNDIVEPDLIVRTGGQMRLSNFLLFQAAYSELVFVDDLWPDINDELLNKILDVYFKRIRNFGSIGE